MKWKRFKLTALSLLLSASLLPQTTLAQDTTIDPFISLDQNYNFGRAASEFDLGGSLGWGQSYYSESYVNMYEATGERFWLDKIVEHTDRMVDNASDLDGDGYLGWPDHRYAHTQVKNNQFVIPGALDLPGTELLSNGSFETDADANNVPDGWTVQGASGSAIRSTTAGDAFDGTAGVILTSDGINSNRLVQPFVYEAGTTYLVEAYAGVESELTEAIIDVFNASSNAVLATIRLHHVGFERYVFTFRAPGSGTLQLRLGLQDYASSGYKARFDSVSIKPVDSVELLPVDIDNGDMEDLNPSDSTLPDGWTRWPASTAANIYVSSDASSGSRSLAVTTDNTSWEVAEQIIDYLPSHTYTLTFKGKVLSSAASGRVVILNTSDNVTLGTRAFTSSSWESHSLTFTAPPVPGKTVKIRLMQTDWTPISFTSLFDDLQLFVSPPSNELIVNGTFESLAPTDVTLPSGWTRASGTTSTDAYVATGINNYYSGSKGLTIQAAPSSTKKIEQTVSYTPGSTYVLTFWARVTDPRYPGTLELYNETDSIALTTMNFDSSNWKKYSALVTAPATTGKTLKLRIMRPSSPGSSIGYVDVVSLQKLMTTDAAGWTRESTPLSAAHRINDATIFTDNWGLRLIHDGTTAPTISSPIDNYRPNSQYGISFSSKVSTGTTGQVRVQDRTTSTTLASWSFSSSDKFELIYDHFTTPAAGHDVVVEVSIPTGSAGHTAWVDAVVVGEMWEHMVHEGVVGSAILRFVNAVYDDSSLHTDYLAKANTYRDFIADNLVHKWDPWWKQMSGVDGSNNGEGVYIFPVGFSTEWFPARSLPHNQYLAFADLLYKLHDATEGAAAYATERPYYWSRANDMARAFKSTVKAHPLNTTLSTDAYVWGYWDPMGAWDNGHYAVYTNEDMSHAALTMAGVIEAYHQGQVFALTDLQKFSRTVTDVMWNQSLTDPVVSYYNSRQPAVTTDKINTGQFGKWTYFAEFDPVIGDIAEAICETTGCTGVMTSTASKWNRNKTINAGFETVSPTVASLPEHWSRWQGSSSTVFRSPTDAPVGDSAAFIVTHGTAWQVMEQQLEDYEPNTEYTISFLGKKYGSINGRVEVYNYTTSTVIGSLIFSDTSWTRNSFKVTTPVNAGNNIRIRLYTANYTPVGQKVGFDDVRAYPSSIGSEIVNAGFETTDRWDTTLPRYWQRGATTISANAVLDTTDKAAGNSSFKLVSAAGAAVQELIYNWKGYTPNASYTATFKAKASGSSGGKLAIVDTATNTELASATISATGWTTLTTTFTAPSVHDRTLQVVIKHNNPTSTGTIWVDEVNISSN